MPMPGFALPSLPPLAAIRAFEAAARHGNFTAAASELGMTQAAVSYQVKVLEDRVGLPLFHRKARGVELTADGRRLADRAGEAMEILRQAFAEARHASDDTLVISVLASFASQILAPRLGRFQIEHPEIMTRVEVDSRVADLQAGEATVAVRSGRGHWPGTEAHFLMYLDFTAMITPAFIALHGRPETPADLLDMPRIDADDDGWADWFRAAGVTPPAPRRQSGMLFGVQVLTVQAALAGDGACLIHPFYFRDLVARGELIRPFPTMMRMEGGLFLCYPARRRNVPAIRAFREWLLAEMQELVPPEHALPAP